MKRIAVVEDEVYMREELCDMLQKDGYLVEAITEYEDAARLLAALRPDLVILDLNLPEISGLCQKELVRHGGRITFISGDILSAFCFLRVLAIVQTIPDGLGNRFAFTRMAL